MEILVNLDIKDWTAYQAHLEKSLSVRNKPWFDGFWFNLISWFVMSTVFFTFFQSSDEFNWSTAGIVTCLFVFIYIQSFFRGIKIKRAFEPLPDGSFCGRHKFNFDDSGICSEGDGYHAEHKWSLVQRVERTNSAIYIFIDSTLAFIFPISKLENPDDFYDYVSSKGAM